ncbi:MAG: hypothetical protein QHH75_04990 [Bacillota bacterium]|nr:hypothetical protein [Bacillota bacterium]
MGKKGFFLRGSGRGSGSLKRGLATSFLLGGLGCLAALLYALQGGSETIYLSSFLVWWLAFSCFCGGLVAGIRGGSGLWLSSAPLGLVFAGFFLILFYGFAPRGVGAGELLVYLGGAAFLASAGALGGANWKSGLSPGRKKRQVTFSRR